MNFQKALKQYDYRFPSELIAQKPSTPRDRARLLIYGRKTRKIAFDRFANIAKYLPKRAVLVFNETKVLPARLALRKATGGRVRILYVRTAGKYIEALADRPLAVGARLTLNRAVYFTVIAKDEKRYVLAPSFPVKNIERVLFRYGTAPLPPYIKHPGLSGKHLRAEYQSVFARHSGSIAAPTASLHFTKPLLARLRRAGIDVQFVTLHVNLGTFLPITEAQWRKGELHREEYHISPKTASALNRAIKEKRSIIAVGTTVARTLESAATPVIPDSIRSPESSSNGRIPASMGMTMNQSNGKLKQLRGDTTLFIKEGYRFKTVKGLVTNFHVPRSSLLMLVGAFVGRKKLMELYRQAIQKKFRLFSFGDGMLVL